MIPDDVLPAAFAIVQSPKRYALLLGSGVSQSAGIRTGKEITQDRIRKIAHGLGETIEGKPGDWYQQKHGTKPTFSNLFNKSGTPEDQEAALREYFTVDGAIPQPTEAHRTIARMVKEGLISLIITTNFDDLLEQALRDEGIHPVVITEGSDPAKMSVIPDQCRVVKVNGSYPGTPLKMTPEDLASYTPEIAGYLDRIFSEYGLIACGWSATGDTGLTEILTRERVRRHTIYWCHIKERGKIPDSVMRCLDVAKIPISSADEFFGELHTRIEVLQRYNRTESMEVATAVKKVRDALRGPRPDLVLSDLINTETDRVYQTVIAGNYLPEGGSVVAQEHFKDTLEDFERLSGPLAAMAAMIAYYDDGANTGLIVDAIERLINIPCPEPRGNTVIRGTSSGTEYYRALYRLRRYPALLVVYAAGIAAVKKGNLSALEAIFTRPKIKTFIEFSWHLLPYHEKLNIWYTIAHEPDWILDFNYERYEKKENVHYYLYRVIQSILQPIIPNELAYDGAFDTFEYLYSLSYLRLTPSSLEGKSAIRPPLPLLSRIWVNTVGFQRGGEYRFPEPTTAYLKDIQKMAEGSDFFGGDLKVFERINRKFAEFFKVRAPETGIEYFPGGLL